MEGKEALYWELEIYCIACARVLLAAGKTYEVWRCERCSNQVASGIDFMRKKQSMPFVFEIL